MKFVLLIVALTLATSVSAQNYPCSKSAGGINHCEGASFICNDGRVSHSTKYCPDYFHSESPSKKSTTVPKQERHKRKASTVTHFKKTHTCPSTGTNSQKCPGYIVDHIVALACGGEDDVSNMQYQTVEDAKAKDKVELNCSLL